jgi:hypothetical protein
MLEKVTGEEFVAMFSLASKSSDFKKLWSYHEAKISAPEETPFGDDCTETQSSYTLSNFDRQNLGQVASPITDPSPSPGPRVAHHPRQFRYYLMWFAGFKLPVLAVGCFESVSKKMICPFGGSKNGARYFLSSWR